MSATNDGTTAVKHRIALGWAAFGKNKQLLTSKLIPLHIKAKIYNTYILPHTYILIMAMIKSRTLKLFGHIKRSQIGLSKLCLEGLVEGKRSRGRQPKRWRDNVYEWSGLDLTTLNRTTQDGNLWRRMTHVGAHSATSGDSET